MLKARLYRFIGRFVFPNKGVTHIKRSPKLIVSLTSYPGRIHVVEQTIESILRQSLKPDAVILWLADSQFPNKEKSLPKSLLRYKKFGLQVRWCDDLKSYKKLIPALKEFPDDIIVTADDDIIFWENWLEAMYASYLKHPDCIHGHHAYFYQFDEELNLLKTSVNNTIGVLNSTNILGSGAGILFPSHSLAEEATIEDFMKIAPSNDDMWWWAMAKLKQTPLLLIEQRCENIVCIENTQDNGLWMSINSKGEGSRQFKNIINRFPSLRTSIE